MFDQQSSIQQLMKSMNNKNRAHTSVSFEGKFQKRKKEQTDSSDDEAFYERRDPQKKHKYNGGYDHDEISISSESKDSGVIRFENQNEKAIEEKDVVPWISNRTTTMKDSLLRLHNEIIEFYNYVKPSKKSHAIKMKKFNFIKDQINEMFPEVSVIAFGSFATQLYLPDGDVDVAILTNGHYDQTQVYNKVNKYLQQKCNSQIFTHIEYIRKSKVPLIKFQYEGIHFDISVNKQDGINQVKYVQKINEIFPEFKYLTLVLKCTLRIRGLADTYTGGIGSFLLSCMLLVYLKQTVEKQNYYTLAEHLIEFMKFYCMSDEYWKNKVIYVREGAIRDRNYDGNYFSCISPQDQSHDIGRSAFKIREAFHVLKNRCRYILDKNFEPGESILRVLVNPSDQIFRYLKESNHN